MKLTERPHPRLPWFVVWEFGWNKKLQETLKAIPGCYWEPDAKGWAVPVEVAELIKHKWRVENHEDDAE